jgi:hypothetical protein
MEPGTVSHGTLRPQDLVPAFLSVLEELAPSHYAALMVQPFPLPPSYAMEDEDSEWWQSEECGYFLEELYDLLDEHAPEGTYFGAHEGDGSDFGFWPIEYDSEDPGA